MSLILPDNLATSSAPIGFAFAALRYGPRLSGEHEWLRLDRDTAAGFECTEVQMRVLPGHCTAIAAESEIEVELLISSECTNGRVRIQHAMAGDSVIEVKGVLHEPVASTDSWPLPGTIDVPIRAGSALRILARLERGSRLEVKTRAA